MKGKLKPFAHYGVTKQLRCSEIRTGRPIYGGV